MHIDTKGSVVGEWGLFGGSQTQGCMATFPSRFTDKISIWLKCKTSWFDICIHCGRIPTIELIIQHLTNLLFFIVRILKFYSLSNLQLCNSIIDYSQQVIHEILRPYSSYNWMVVPLYQPLLISSTPSPSQPLFDPLVLWVQHYFF